MFQTYSGTITNCSPSLFKNYISENSEIEYVINFTISLDVLHNFQWDKIRNCWTDCQEGGSVWSARNREMFDEVIRLKTSLMSELSDFVKAEEKSCQQVKNESNRYYLLFEYQFRTIPLKLEELEMLLDIIKRYQTKTGKEDSYSMSIQTPDEFMNQW